MKDELKDLVHLSMLYDFYGELLGEHKAKIFEDYVLNDLSLSEIADEAGMSRQGVHDAVRRCSMKLKEYEEKLHLVRKFERTKHRVEEIKRLSKKAADEKEFDNIFKIELIAQEILDEL